MDAELRVLLARDLPRGFEALVRAYQHRLFAFALGLSGDPSDAEEVAQDAFLRAHRALQRYGATRIGELALSAWLHRITLNVFRNRIRRRRLRLVALDFEPGLEPADPTPGPEQVSLSRMRLRELANLVSGLPATQRDAVVLRCVQGLSYAQAGGVLGRPEVTVRSDVHRGLAALRRRAGELSEVI